MKHEIIQYDQTEYPFVELIASLFKDRQFNLDHIHLSGQDYRYFNEPSKDSDTEFHKAFYDKMRSGWDEFLYTYRKFIYNFIEPKLEHSIIYQKWPTFRVHLPNNLAVGAWHTDGEFHHPEGEINFILPITKMFESNTVILESEPGLRDFTQIELSPGEVFMFNGNKCMHGNLPNRTNKTRISLDFRVLMKKDYNTKETKSSLTTKRKFLLGDYYDNRK